MNCSIRNESFALADGKGAGGDDARRVLLREGETIHQHRFSGDVGCGCGAVADAFRTIVIHHPIRRGQASFIDGNHFFCERGRELRDALLLHAHQQASCGVVAGLRGAGEDALIRCFHAVGQLGDGGVGGGGFLCQREGLAGEVAEAVIFKQRGGGGVGA